MKRDRKQNITAPLENTLRFKCPYCDDGSMIRDDKTKGKFVCNKCRNTMLHLKAYEYLKKLRSVID